MIQMMSMLNEFIITPTAIIYISSFLPSHIHNAINKYLVIEAAHCYVDEV